MNRDKRINWIIAIAVTLVTALIMGVFFDYFYDLNDDVLIKDILSGAYLGEPSSRNNQNLWLFGIVVSTMYRILPAVPWYGILLIVFQYGSMAVILNRSLELLKSDVRTLVKVVTAIFEAIILAVLAFNHLVNIQYTFTVALMAGAAILWIIAQNTDCTPKEYLKQSVPSIVIIFVAFNLRSEMMLLMLPYVLVAVLIKFTFDKSEASVTAKVKSAVCRKLIKHGCMLAVIVGSMLIALGINGMAYSSDDWRYFTDFFDARTELYDFQVIPSYEENREFYDSINLSKEEEALLENYNFGIDDNITSDTIWQVAGYANQSNPKAADFTTSLKDNLRLYLYRITHDGEAAGSDYPYNLIGLVLYILPLVLLFRVKRYLGILDIAVLFVGRTLIWIYMMMGNRMPDRITHSLYFVEMSVLLGFLFWLVGEDLEKELKEKLLIVPATCSIVFFGLIIPNAYRELGREQSQRCEINAAYEDLYLYAAEHPSNYYMTDVYSTVSYSEKIFGKAAGIDKSNFNTLGGWYTHSPIEALKESKFNILTQEEGLLEDNVFYVTDKTRSTAWLTDYYKYKDIEIELDQVEELGGVFEIYEVNGN